MDTSNTKTASDFTEKLETYQRLSKLREGLQKRIDKATAEQETVSEHIFERVMGEYRRELKVVEEDLVPLDEELDAAMGEIENECHTAKRSLAELQDELSEVEFRARVGEYTDGDITEARDRIMPQIRSQEGRVSQLEAQLDGLKNRATSKPAASAPVDPAPETAPAPKPKPKKADTRIEDLADEPDEAPASTADGEPGHAMEDWMKEFGDEAAPAAKASQTAVEVEAAPEAAPAAKASAAAVEVEPEPEAAPKAKADAKVEPEDDDDPLAALADPTPSDDTASSSTSGDSFLTLVVRSGGHAGKRVPLLPMTMSIGREHDNNIELKDPDVARYHARITYCDGQFALENLVGSTGTWVNDEPAQDTVLSAGDVIRLGTTEITVE